MHQFYSSASFLHYLLAGHGRCFAMLWEDPEQYREQILQACTHDFSFDLQCEGSRALFVFNLVMQYEDCRPFLYAAIRKFLAREIDEDWHEIAHLGDLLCLFAEDGEATAQAALEQKYHDLYLSLMTGRFSARAARLIDSLEYLAILLVEQQDWKCTEQILSDIGAWYIRRRRADAQDLKWRFHWLFDVVKREYGESTVNERLLSASSKELRCFYRVQMLPDEPRTRTQRRRKRADAVLSADEIQNVHDLAINALQKAPDSEAIEQLLQFYQPGDDALLMPCLDALPITQDNHTGWHDVTLAILNKEEREHLPDELLLWIYERSLCSCCRKDAVQILLERGSFPDACWKECRWDCNTDIRILFDEKQR